MGFVTVFTLVSVSLYLVEWVRHMSTIEARRSFLVDAFPRRSRIGDACVTQARAFNLVSLPLALPHAESLTRDDFLGRARQCKPALALIESWPDWPNRIMLLVGTGGLGQEPPRRDLGRTGRRTRDIGARADAPPPSRRALRPARWWSKT